jgi:hypothetical protein
MMAEAGIPARVPVTFFAAFAAKRWHRHCWMTRSGHLLT